MAASDGGSLGPDEPLPRTILTPPQGVLFIPDVPNWTWAEYGMRIGFWRMKEALDRRGLKAVFCINGSVIERYPRLCQAALEAGWEFMGHNIIQKPMHAMPNEEEAIQKTVAIIQKFTGAKPRGWMGPGLTGRIEPRNCWLRPVWNTRSIGC